MSVSLHTNSESFAIGSSQFFASFFDTIEGRLTKGLFGKKYPVVLNEFYEGCVGQDHLDQARRELEKIRARFKKLDPSAIIWDRFDPDSNPPWGDDISDDITDLSTYFVTCDGKDLFEVIFVAIDCAKKENSDLTIS